MDSHAPNYFADVVRLAQSTFKDVIAEVDVTPARAILRLQAQYGSYRIFITELLDESGRKYRYYVLQGSNIEAGREYST